MKFNIDDYKGKYAMHCKTEEEAEDFCKFLDSIGRRWLSGRKYTESTNCYGTDIFYYFNEGMFDLFIPTAKYKVLEWSDFMNKEFTKADLKSGDVVLERGGNVGIACPETNSLIFRAGTDTLSNLNMDLTSIAGKNYDVMEVRRPVLDTDCYFDIFKHDRGEVVYKRKEVEERRLKRFARLWAKRSRL